MKKLFIFLILGMSLFLAGLASAECTNELPPSKQNTLIQLTQVCDNCTYVNITKLVYPNQSFALLGEYSMTKNGVNFNYSYNPSGMGTYYYTTQGDLNGVLTSQSVCFEVTPTGNLLSTGSSLIYIVLLVILLILDFVIFYIVAVLRLDNPRNDEGNAMGISVKKYLKILLIGISYGLMMLTLNLANALALSSGQITQFSGIIGGLFTIMLRGAWVWTLAILIWMAITAWKDNQLVKEIRKRLEEGEWFE